ncbi:MAG: alpha/beta hydrolase [Pseudomonadota bacterium]
MLKLDPSLFRPKGVPADVAAFNADLEAKLADAPAMHELPAAVVRQAREEGRSIVPSGGPLPSGSDYRDVPTPMGRVRVSLPEGDPEGVYIHLHGGGWTMGAPHIADEWCQYLAREARCAVVSVPYRLGPENRWPACADDAEAGAMWVLEQAKAEFGTDRVAIGGESAGAHLAAVTLLRLRDKGANGIEGALLHYGVFDLAMTPSAAMWGERNMILSTPTIRWFQENLTGESEKLRDPKWSPLYADLTDMPPALFQCGTVDPLIDDTLMMAARWAGSGAATEVEIYPGAVHAFDMFPTEQAAAARARGAAFLRSVFGGRT